MEVDKKKRRRKSQPLFLECTSEPLTPEQISYYGVGEKEYNDFAKKFQAFIAYKGTSILEQGEHVTLLEYVTSENTNNSGALGLFPLAPPPPGQMSLLQPQPQKKQPSSHIVVASQPQAVTTPNNQLIVQNAGSPANAIQLVMDPRGLIVGAVTTANTVQPQQKTTVTNNAMISGISTAPVNSTSTVPIAAKAPKNSTKRQPGIRRVYNSQAANSAPKPTESATKKRTHESTSIGGIVAGALTKSLKQPSADIVDLTEDEASVNNSDTKEVSINKMSGKTYPSLVVVARPHLSIREYSQTEINEERLQLDSRVKKVLMVSANSFTEWLLQQGLVRCEQTCGTHKADGLPVKLKLGMYSDASKFPYSGGYVWISECCPQQFVSVFSGSIFEGAPHPPNVILKLLYHWACHTSIQNVVQWVKVDNLYVKNIYTTLRAVCTAALHNKFQKMGGSKKKIQVGVISLGTTTQEGNCRQVKVEVLGVLDPENKNLRIRAIEPIQEGEHNYKKRFMKILEPLQYWVEKDSIILTDFTVDKGTLNLMGYNTVYQLTPSDTNPGNSRYSNQNIMEYLRKIVPRMFQNTLSLLSRQIIQQFLDELVWREMWGPIPSKAFSSIVDHLAEQTKLDTGGTLLNRLAKIASNPFKNWKYDRWAANCKITNAANAAFAEPWNSGANNAVIQQVPTPPPAVQASTLPPVSAPTFDVISPIIQGESAVNKRKQSGRGNTGRAIRGRPSHYLSKGQVEQKPPSTSNALDSSAKQDISAPHVSPEVSTEVDPNSIPVEPYFYASIPGNPNLMRKTQFPQDIKCVLCSALFKNNIQLMDHLIKHAINKGQNNNKELCKLCYKISVCDYLFKFRHLRSGNNSPGMNCTQCSVSRNNATNGSPQNHIESNRAIRTCLICAVTLKDLPTYIAHMSRTHYEMEMPYICYVCNFRTSGHEDLVKHFYDAHDGGYSGVCPYCFKVVDFYRDEALPQNQYFYIIHIQRHQLSPLTKKCSRCAMWFINKTTYEEHDATVHHSCKNLPGAQRFKNKHYTMMAPPPSCHPLPPRTERIKVPTITSNFQVASFKPLRMDPIAKNSICCECEGKIKNDHFLGFMSCTKCKYQTCCQRAMTEHNSTAHFSYSPRFIFGRPVILEKPLYCSCSFSTNNGHLMAKHLFETHMTTCYFSKEKANQSIIRSRSASLDTDEEMLWLNAYSNKPPKPSVKTDEPKSILNSLGLVRKPSVEETLEDAMESEASACAEALAMGVNKEQKDDKSSRMAIDPDIIEIMDYEETDDTTNMAVDKSPSPEAMVLD